MNKNLLKVLSTTVLFGGILAGCGDAEVTKVDEGNTTEQQAPAAEKTEEKKDQVYKVGDTVSIDGMEVTLNSVTWGTAAEYSPAANGKVLRVEATAKNSGSDNGFIDSTEFQLYAGDTVAEMYFGNADANQAGGELKKGKTMPLIMEYDVPETESYELFYEPSFTFSENAEIKFVITKGEIK